MNGKWKKWVLLLGDVCALYVGLVITLLLRYGQEGFTARFDAHVLPFSLLFIGWILVFYLADLYRLQVLRHSSLFSRLSLSIVIAVGVSVAFFYLFSEFFKLTPKTNLFIFSALFLFLSYGWRRLATYFFTSGALNVTLIGTTPLIENTLSFLKDHPHLGYHVAAHLNEVNGGDLHAVTCTLKDTNTNLLVLQSSLTKDFRIARLVYRLLPLEVAIMPFWNFYELIFEKAPLEEIEEEWFIEHIATRRTVYDTVKRFFDILCSFMLLTVCSPFFLLIACAIACSSQGPVFFIQERVGKNEKLFSLLKFRTMYHMNRGPLWTEENDNRVTPVGKLLRFTHLDELPQLWNVLKGDISFIGPRPERKELAEYYHTLPYYEMRHVVKPGITGWAQTNYKPSTSREEAFEKLHYDIYYIKNRSFVLDLLILLKTIRYVFLSHSS